MFIDQNVILRDTVVESRENTLALTGLPVSPGRVALLFPQHTTLECQQSLELVSQIEAGLDNVVSALRLRWQELDRMEIRESFGNGAGASVEADRG